MPITALAANIFSKEDFADSQNVVVALSGGGDSMALLLLVQEFLATLDHKVTLYAVTVDHVLRAESGQEAAWVKQQCAKHNIFHETVTWDQLKPPTGLTYHARIARYNLLFNEAEKFNANIILTGHTLEDQVETFIMRQSRNSRRGLAVMPRQAVLMNKVTLLRPLLETRRQSLRDYLKARQQSWVEDPSNENEDYERVRTRKTLTPELICQTSQSIKAAALLRRQQSSHAKQLIEAISPTLKHDCLSFAYPPSDILAHKDFGFVMGTLAAIQGGSQYFPNDAQTGCIQNFMMKPRDQLTRTTLAGSVIELRPQGVRIWRESRNMPTVEIEPGECGIWDNRYQIINNSDQLISASPARITDLKALMAQHNLATNDYHFFSLQSALSIKSHLGVDIPAVTGEIKNHHPIAITRYVRPFAFIVSGDDLPLYETLMPLFANYGWSN